MLPVIALAVGLVALLALAVPGVRDQIELSASHQPQEYVALSFARAADGTVPVCTSRGSEVTVRFTVESGLGAASTLPYVVTAGSDRRTGTVAVEPGESVDVTQVLSPAKRRYGVTVRLPAADREIIAHCRDAGPGKGTR